ncbi:MAG: ArnT family glycosyltransferase [Candidatus Zhuqueibacterota bacterium]
MKTTNFLNINIFGREYSHKHKLLFIFFLALILRFSFLFLSYQNWNPALGDDEQYISYAKNMIDQGVFVPEISKLFRGSHIVGPGFPLIVATIFSIFGENYLIVFAVNAIISALTCVLIYFLGKELFNEKIAFFSSLWSCFYLLNIIYIPRVLKESWLFFLFALTIYLFIVEIKNKIITWRMLFFAFIYTFLIHLDERFFSYFPLFVLAFILLDLSRWKIGAKKGLIFSFVVLIFMIPWTIRNYEVYGKIVILTVRTSMITDRLFYIKHPIEQNNNRLSVLWHTITNEDSFRINEHNNAVQEELESNIKAAEVYGLIPYKYNSLKKLYIELKEFWTPMRFKPEFVEDGFRFEKPWSLKHNLISGVLYGTLLPFFIFGCVILIKKKDQYGIFILSVIIIHTAIHLFLAFARNRYRAPIDSFIILIAFYGIQRIHFFLKGKSKNYLSWSLKTAERFR